MNYQSMADIFRGLAQTGAWGCFDEFNRVQLPVLSVVAQQVQAIVNAKRIGAGKFTFPGEAYAHDLDPNVRVSPKFRPYCRNLSCVVFATRTL